MKFKITFPNRLGISTARIIEADSFNIEGSFVVFYKGASKIFSTNEPCTVEVA